MTTFDGDDPACPEPRCAPTSNPKLRMVEPFHTEAHVTAEVFFGKLGSPGIVVIQADTDEGPADVTLTPREAFDLMLWLQCALSVQPVETTPDCPGCMKCLEQEERATAYADQLAGMVGVLVGEDMGEHSSENEPWENAIEALRVAIGSKQSSVEPTAPHTIEEDFQHWLSYSGTGSASDADLRAAYYAGADAQ